MRKAFTLIEFIFVIIIFGILSAFGAELLYKVYENYVYSNTFNRLQNQSEVAVKQIANRLQYRIKDSTIARNTLGATAEPIGGTLGGTLGNENVLEWIGTDIEGWRGRNDTSPDWSGFIDLNSPSTTSTQLHSLGTKPDSTSGASGDRAIFFIGSNVDLNSNAFGWNGTAVTGQSGAMHPIKPIAAADIIEPKAGTNFVGIDVYEYYKLSASAYAVELNTTTNNLTFYYNYQPWLGETASANGSSALIMENVDSFKFTSMGDILVIQVCVSDNNVTGVGEYAVCKEKVVF